VFASRTASIFRSTKAVVAGFYIRTTSFHWLNRSRDLSRIRARIVFAASKHKFCQARELQDTTASAHD
jgi:hypothetical protein